MFVFRTLLLAVAAVCAAVTVSACDTESYVYDVPENLRECYDINNPNTSPFTSIQACAINRSRDAAYRTGVYVYYHEPALTWKFGTDSSSKLKIWFKLNGKSSTFEMFSSCYRGYCSAHIFLPFDNTCKSDLYGLWFYAFNGNQANNWDVEFAVVSTPDNTWDNNDSKNFKFTFNK